MTTISHGQWRLLGCALSLGILLGCEGEGVGDPCVPEDEYFADFSGFGVTEVLVESRSFQCETRVCLVNHFQGRVTCPEGQDEGGEKCRVPGQGDIPVSAPVKPQLVERRAERAVYCSCRCDGPDPNARYCDCPDGFSCVELIESVGVGSGQLAGSYCIKEGTKYDEETQLVETCRDNPDACE